MNLLFSFFENDVRLHDVRLNNVHLNDVHLNDSAYIITIYLSESKSFTLIYAQLSAQNAPALQSKSYYDHTVRKNYSEKLIVRFGTAESHLL